MNKVRIISEGILDKFADSVHSNRHRIYRLWIITPWFGYDDYRDDPIYVLIDALRKSTCTVTFITRPPKSDWHKKANDLVVRDLKPIIYHCENLHTKLYILECNGYRTILLGSPNLTPNANKRNKELAVEFCTTETDKKIDVVRIVNDLIDYASNLRYENDVVLA